jgi:hypothetical protein
MDLQTYRVLLLGVRVLARLDQACTRIIDMMTRRNKNEKNPFKANLRFVLVDDAHHGLELVNLCAQRHIA